MAVELASWDPVREAFGLGDAVERLLQGANVAPTAFIFRDVSDVVPALPLDMYETADQVVVQAALPGANREEVKVELEEGYLTIEANIPAPKIENVTWQCRERSYGKYSRAIELPVLVKEDAVEATLENGILTVSIPKADEVKPKKIQVKAIGK